MERELTGCYPIILDGSEKGNVTINREGLFWRFDARCEMRDELLRLSVYGGGAEGYLGVLEPIDGELRLTKMLSKNALAGFPKTISFATRAGEVPPVNAYIEELEVSPPKRENSSECERDLPPEDDKPPPGACSPPPSQISKDVWRHCPLPCSLFSDLGAKALCGDISGALMKRDKDGVLLAVPEHTAHRMPNNDFLIFSDTEIISGRPFRLANVKNK